MDKAPSSPYMLDKEFVETLSVIFNYDGESESALAHTMMIADDVPGHKEALLAQIRVNPMILNRIAEQYRIKTEFILRLLTLPAHDHTGALLPHMKEKYYLPNE